MSKESVYQMFVDILRIPWVSRNILNIYFFVLPQTVTFKLIN